MATKEIKWNNLTSEERKTLTKLQKSGVEIFAAPILIEENAESRKRQFASLGISWDDCKTWKIGSEQVRVHLTPANEATYHMLLNDLRAKHRSDYRVRRCMVPGKRKPLVRCPEHNRCAECPHPEYRDHHETNVLSWDALIEEGYEEISTEADTDAVENKMELEAVFKELDAKNPKFKQAFIMKELYGMTVTEIAEAMHDTNRNIYHYLGEAKRIGKLYKRDNQY